MKSRKKMALRSGGLRNGEKGGFQALHTIDFYRFETAWGGFYGSLPKNCGVF